MLFSYILSSIIFLLYSVEYKVLDTVSLALGDKASPDQKQKCPSKEAQSNKVSMDAGEGWAAGVCYYCV